MWPEGVLCRRFLNWWRCIPTSSDSTCLGIILSSSLLAFRFQITLILLTWRIWWAPNNASKWQMGFNSAFKGLIEQFCDKADWFDFYEILFSNPKVFKMKLMLFFFRSAKWNSELFVKVGLTCFLTILSPSALIIRNIKLSYQTPWPEAIHYADEEIFIL